MRHMFVIIGAVFVAATAWGPVCRAADAPVRQVWIYRGDLPAGQLPATARLFQPFGIMPAERATSVAVAVAEPRDPNDLKKGTCVEIDINFNHPTDWSGTYWLLNGGTAWGSVKGIDVQKLMGLEPDDQVALRLLAWGTGNVSFKCGGVNDGAFPSSLRFPVAAPDTPTTLQATPTEITIGPFAAKRLVNIIDPLCIVASGLDQNRESAKVATVFVADVRFEPYEKPKPRKAAADYRTLLRKTLWATYTPTDFDPTVTPVKAPTVESIRKDLTALKNLAKEAGLPDGALGIATYGIDNGGQVQISSICRDLGILQQLGIFSPSNREEVANAKRLLRDASLDRTIVGVIVGNESLTFRRATIDDIERVIADLGAIREVPFTSTEIVQEMGNERLRRACTGYLSVNAHALFSNVHNPENAARWVERQIESLRDVAGDRPLLIKEPGFPDGPPPFSTEAQKEYWSILFSSPQRKYANIGIFDGFRNTPWKHETLAVAGGTKVDIGNHWGVLLNEHRLALPSALDVLRTWKQNRSDAAELR